MCKRTTAALDDEEACPDAKKAKRQPGPPRLVVTPQGADLQRRLCDATVDTDFFLANGGDTDLHIANVQLANDQMNVFTFAAPPPSGVTIAPNGVAVQVTVRCHSRRAGQAAARLLVTADDPADAPAQGVRTLALAALLAYPLPIIKFLLRDGSDRKFVRVGLWDDAWNPQTGALYNDAADAHQLHCP